MSQTTVHDVAEVKDLYFRIATIETNNIQKLRDWLHCTFEVILAGACAEYCSSHVVYPPHAVAADDM